MLNSPGALLIEDMTVVRCWMFRMRMHVIVADDRDRSASNPLEDVIAVLPGSDLRTTVEDANVLQFCDMDFEPSLA